MKNLKKTAMSMAVAAAMMLTVVPVGAAGVAGTNYGTTIGGTKTTTFDKYLVIDKQAEVPNASFTYAVTAGKAKTYDVEGKKFQVLAGVDADKVTMAGVGATEAAANTIVYKQGDAVKTDANALVKNYDNTTQKYALKTATLDFSGCKFTEPGVYRYVITESGTNQGITNDADATRIVDVYVNDATTAGDAGEVKALTIAGYVLHSNADDEPDVAAGEDYGSAGAYVATKSQGYTNSYDTSDLTFRNEVSGNQASHDKYFEFTVKIADAVAGTVYDVDITGADATSLSNAATIAGNAGKANVTSLTVGADGTVTQKFYLQHGQEIKIQGLAKDTTYDITENTEDYKSAEAAVTGYADPVSGTVTSADLKTSYKNTRDGVIPTGIVMAVAPFAAATIFGGAGAVTIAMKKKKNRKEDGSEEE